METKDLIDRAARTCGSTSAVARAMGVNSGRVFEWRSGSRPCPPDRVDQLAELAGLPMETRVRTVWEAVRRAAGKTLAALALGAVAITLVSSLGGPGALSVAGSGSFRRR